jgi:hypothetical protein
MKKSGFAKDLPSNQIPRSHDFELRVTQGKQRIKMTVRVAGQT